jgi:hypothetical protein
MKKITLIIGALMVLILTGCNFSPNQNPATPNNEAGSTETSGDVAETPGIPANCTSWFDGCNNCFVENGKIGGCTRMYCNPENTKEPKCLEFKGEENKDVATQPKTNDCVQNGGTWDGEYSECFGVDKTTCESINGQFDECASACRHDPKAEVCTMQCVQVCNVK